MSFGARPTGYSGPNASLPASLYVEDNASAGSSTASFTMNSNGTYSSVGNLSSVSGTWQTGTGTGSSYDVRVTLITGTFSSGTTGTWVSLSTTRSWSCVQSSPGFKYTNATLEIRDASTLAVLATSDLTVQASVGIPP